MMPHDTFILVVDDQAEIRDGLTLTLAAAGYHALTAPDGAEALQCLHAHPVHLILADIGMPRMNGYQLYERVRAEPDLVVIPFVFLTARGIDSDIRYGKELGADDYLVKPVEPEDLLAAVAGRLRRVAQLASAAGLTPTRPGDLVPERDPEELQLGALRLSARQRRAWLHHRLLDLSAREFTVLEYLMRRPSAAVPLRELVRISHGLETNDGEAALLLRPLMRLLRRKLGYNAGELGCIESVRSIGYRLIPPA
ncbi:MAG: response regulator transcription factor [Chloroflexales bacterium]|nr:response regulator transcription factor [Chloroflexales bacterium]